MSSEVVKTQEQRQPHGMFPASSHDELAGQQFVHMLKSTIETTVHPEVRNRYEEELKTRFVADRGREPQDRNDVREAVEADPVFRRWTALRRATQFLLWTTVGESVTRQLGDLVARAEAPSGVGGSLELDPSLSPPSYVGTVDIHRMPTGYCRELGAGDVAAGAMYDAGVRVYTLGQLGSLNDAKGRTVIENFLKVKHPDLSPRRILDMGCSVGHSTLPYVDAYPEAEVHAIDIGAPMVRYAHRRAEALGKRVHFAQQNAEQTRYPDGHFDLIVSHILLHETSTQAKRNIFAECRRLLAPGGLMVHAEYARFTGLDPFTQYLLDWDTYHNNEPCWGPTRAADLVALALGAGFGAEQIEYVAIPTTRRLLGQPQQQSPTNQFYLVVGYQD